MTKKSHDIQAELDDLRRRVAYLSRKVTWMDERIKKLEGQPPKSYKTTNYDCNPELYALQRENYFLRQGIKKEEIEQYLFDKKKGQEHGNENGKQ